jgi:Tol biopolymer transport system component
MPEVNHFNTFAGKNIPMKHLLSYLVIFCLSLSACNTQTKNGNWKGKLLYTYSAENIKTYDLSTGKDKVILKESGQASYGPDGQIYFIDQRFRKRNALIRKSNAAGTQYKDVIDLSSENPEFRKQLDEYSVINGTGKSGILSTMYNPVISPNGKYLAVTILGYPGYVFEENSVNIFELATARLIKSFKGKYHASWTPDNRVVMAGSHLAVSTDDSPLKVTEPGIFISNEDFSNVTRIDRDFDDPSPYHPSVSPDGTKVAFVLNNHIWVMGIDGSNPIQLTDADNDNQESFPAWSPDGKHIACWVYKTFERSYYTAIAIIPSTTKQPIVLSDKAKVWPRDAKGFRISGGGMQISWTR